MTLLVNNEPSFVSVINHSQHPTFWELQEKVKREALYYRKHFHIGSVYSHTHVRITSVLQYK